mmetsp:Transcript_13936/g.28902  ORF Transcript_13936/g.28902 Transcript_13936/m.28902 type:complete len:205 (+) Transcript_13936:141-755(+)
MGTRLSIILRTVATPNLTRRRDPPQDLLRIPRNDQRRCRPRFLRTGRRPTRHLCQPPCRPPFLRLDPPFLPRESPRRSRPIPQRDSQLRFQRAIRPQTQPEIPRVHRLRNRLRNPPRDHLPNRARNHRKNPRRTPRNRRNHRRTPHNRRNRPTIQPFRKNRRRIQPQRVKLTSLPSRKLSAIPRTKIFLKYSVISLEDSASTFC